MYVRMFAVYDSKALAFLQPFFSNSNGSAICAFEDAVHEVKTPIGAHPGDYQLYELGGFNDEDGNITVLRPNKLLCNGLDFVSSLTEAKEA